MPRRVVSVGREISGVLAAPVDPPLDHDPVDLREDVHGHGGRGHRMVSGILAYEGKVLVSVRQLAGGGRRGLVKGGVDPVVSVIQDSVEVVKVLVLLVVPAASVEFAVEHARALVFGKSLEGGNKVVVLLGLVFIVDRAVPLEDQASVGAGKAILQIPIDVTLGVLGIQDGQFIGDSLPKGLFGVGRPDLAVDGRLVVLGAPHHVERIHGLLLRFEP
mmetsp:Transcript_11534/g.27094  ORF Transcript_11534/g.27094 Transcript_11534/m.27094 type:complete len:217 (-) Transcript_11534:596-1246(-)